MKKFFFAVLRLVLIPVIVWLIGGLLVAVVQLTLKMGYSVKTYCVTVGLWVGLVLFSVLASMTRVYVFGHELSHWLMAKLFGRETSGFTIGKGGGHVKVQDPNVWIVLAPYFIPIYTILWIIMVKIANIWIQEFWITAALYSGAGFTYAHHLVTTGIYLSKGQSDLNLYGRVFSLSLIVLLNLATVYLCLSFFAGGVKSGVQLLYTVYRLEWSLTLRLFS